MTHIVKTALAILLFHSTSFSQELLSPDIQSVSANLNQRIDIANLEYDDSPYPGRTNIGHIFIPYLQVDTAPVTLRAGGWFRQVYVQFDEDDSPEKMYPYMSAAFHTGKNSEFLIGNFDNLAPFPNTIYNEFLYFEERPVSAGLKYSLSGEPFGLLAYMDWLETDTEEHPEEFITGLIISHDVFSWLYYRLYNHYHHRGGQLNKDTHPVRIEQDIATSPVIGVKFWRLYLQGEYYNSMFSQNFEPTIYGHAAGGTAGFFTDSLDLSYQFYASRDYYHSDAHLFYLKKKNLLHRIRADYNIYRWKDILDVQFTLNLYGMDPPGIDMRLFARINIGLLEYKSGVNRETAFGENKAGEK